MNLSEGRFFLINANDVYLFLPDNIIALFPLHIIILQKEVFVKFAECLWMFQNVLNFHMHVQICEQNYY